jgi:hypothetical protein
MTKLTVGGKSVLVEATLSQWSIIECPNKPTPGSPNLVPCTKVGSIGQHANKLRVAGSPVVLATFEGKTNGSLQIPISVKDDETKLNAV